MIGYSKQLKELETRVSRGDPMAEGELLNELEPQMQCMVRRAMRTNRGNSPLERLIWMEINRLVPAPSQRPVFEDRGLVRQVAQRVCAAVIDRLRPSHWDAPKDTIPAGGPGYRPVPRMERMKTVMMVEPETSMPRGD